MHMQVINISACCACRISLTESWVAPAVYSLLQSLSKVSKSANNGGLIAVVSLLRFLTQTKEKERNN